jgi:hypothetical protein
MRRSPVSSVVRARQPSARCAARGLLTQVVVSQRRFAMLPHTGRAFTLSARRAVAASFRSVVCRPVPML